MGGDPRFMIDDPTKSTFFTSAFSVSHSPFLIPHSGFDISFHQPLYRHSIYNRQLGVMFCIPPTHASSIRQNPNLVVTCISVVLELLGSHVFSGAIP